MASELTLPQLLKLLTSLLCSTMCLHVLAVTFPPDTTLELANHPNIFAIKEASGDLAQIDFILKNRPPNFLVFSGDDALTVSNDCFWF